MRSPLLLYIFGVDEGRQLLAVPVHEGKKERLPGGEQHHSHEIEGRENCLGI